MGAGLLPPAKWPAMHAPVFGVGSNHLNALLRFPDAGQRIPSCVVCANVGSELSDIQYEQERNQNVDEYDVLPRCH